MLMIPVYPPAMLKAHELEVLSRAEPTTCSILPTPHPDRVEMPVDVTLTTIKALRELAIQTLSLDENTASLVAIPLLLEAIHNQQVHFDELDDIPPPYYYVTQEAFDNLSRYSPSRLVTLINNVPVPDIPVIYNPKSNRTSRFQSLLPKDTYLHLKDIGALIISASSTHDPYHLALDWIGCTIATRPA